MNIKFVPSLLRHLVLIFFSAIMAFPFIWLVLSSFKSADNLFTSPLTFFPETWHFENYINAWNAAPFGDFFINTFIMSAGIVIAQVITCSLAGYALAVIDFKGKAFLFILILGTMMVPFEATLIPTFLLAGELNLLNTHLGLILPSATGVLGIFIMRQHFMTIPKDVIEASVIDGASHFTIFFRILLPLSKSPLATVSIFAFMNAWNSYTWPLLATTTTEMRTVQIGLNYMADPDRGIMWPELLAASTFVIIPILVLFLILQKYFVKGVMHTGTK